MFALPSDGKDLFYCLEEPMIEEWHWSKGTIQLYIGVDSEQYQSTLLIGNILVLMSHPSFLLHIPKIEHGLAVSTLMYFHKY